MIGKWDRRGIGTDRARVRCAAIAVPGTLLSANDLVGLLVATALPKKPGKAAGAVPLGGGASPPAPAAASGAGRSGGRQGGGAAAAAAAPAGRSGTAPPRGRSRTWHRSSF